MFSQETYIQRRAALAGKLSSGLIFLPGNEESPMNYRDNTYHFRQDSTFLYYFGLNQPSLNGLIDADSGECTLYGDEPGIDMIVWTGSLPSLASRAELAGIRDVRPSSALDTAIGDAMKKGGGCTF